jgi:YidC/Oxa1 family membrane protein insertase
MEEPNNKNLILAMVLSALVMGVWLILFPQPVPSVATTDPAPLVAEADASGTTDPVTGQPEVAPVPESARLTIETGRLSGSIALRGGRIDDLSLTEYRETQDAGSDNVRLLSPYGETKPYYALFGWVPAGSLTFDDVPGPGTEWTAAADAKLAPGKPVTLRWENGKGLIFLREISVDENYLFTVTETVENTGSGDVTLASYGQIARHGLPGDLQNIFVVHEGTIRRTDGEITETDYADIPELAVVEREATPAEVIDAATDGWIGFTDHYWMTVLIPEQGKAHTQVTKYVAKNDIYQTEVRNPAITVAAGAKATTTTRLFVGAKEWATIRAYENEGGIPGFIDSIDWGWFYFLTKPIFAVLHWLHGLIGNMGLAIIALTFILKLLVLPLAY